MNVSVRPVGTKELGAKIEIKNMNSFSGVRRALEYEIPRQIEIVKRGGKLVQSTRRWDDLAGMTEEMRTKEDAHDYRYFPDPDLLPLKVDLAWVDRVRKNLPELPLMKMRRFVTEYQIPDYDAHILTQTRPLSEFYEDVAKKTGNAKAASNWIMGDLMRILNDQKKEIQNSPVSSVQLIDLIKSIDSGQISGKIAKGIFEEIAQGNADGQSVAEIIKKNNLVQVTDTKAIETVIDKVIAANAAQVEQYRAGKDKVFGFFVGQVMKEMKGQGAPNIVNEILKKKLKGE